MKGPALHPQPGVRIEKARSFLAQAILDAFVLAQREGNRR
jgi:hypothetical protein